MLETCPVCEKKTVIERIDRKEKIWVRGKPIEVMAIYYKCSECGNEYLNTMDDNHPLESAYHKYREINNMLQPEEIKELRRSIGLTQEELSNLLGWGKATLSRYENGALQDKAHDNQLKMLKDSKCVIHLIRANPSALPSWKRSSIIERLKHPTKGKFIIDDFIEEYIAPDKIDEWNGYVPFAIEKINHLILYFCKDGLWKTAINKFLFYADFKHFKEYVKGITGSRYKRLPLGPVPDCYEIILGKLVDEGLLQVKEIFFESGVSGLKYKTIEEPNLAIFSDTELEVIARIKNYFKDFGARKISDFSHQEEGYKKTIPNEYITYDYAKYLKV